MSFILDFLQRLVSEFVFISGWIQSWIFENARIAEIWGKGLLIFWLYIGLQYYVRQNYDWLLLMAEGDMLWYEIIEWMLPLNPSMSMAFH